MAQSQTCPSCKLPNATAPHCPSPTCGWVRCESCHVVVDPTTGRGWDKDHKPIQLGSPS